MPQKEPFFSWASLKQPVNQWLCIAFLSLWCFWTVLYYFTEKTIDIGNNLAAVDQHYVKK